VPTGECGLSCHSLHNLSGKNPFTLAPLHVHREAAAVFPAAGEQAALRRLMVPALATWDADAVPPAAKRLVAREHDPVGGDLALRFLAEKMVQKHMLTRSADQAGASSAIGALPFWRSHRSRAADGFGILLA
jgi:hypothetical protein